jgi:hypothetical protein
MEIKCYINGAEKSVDIFAQFLQIYLKDYFSGLSGRAYSIGIFFDYVARLLQGQEIILDEVKFKVELSK